MTKIHYFQRYSTVENTVTNNTLQLLARIYEYSAVKASQLLSELAGQPIEIGIEVNQQERGAESVPDGAIIQRSFKILMESKVDSPVDRDQLRRHANEFDREEKKVLLLLTKQQIGKMENEIRAEIADKHPDVIFKNITYEDICQVISRLFQEYEYDMRALVDDYVEYCNDTGLFDQSKYLMRIVPCGQTLDINIKYGIYFHPSDRGYTPHQYLGVYKDKAVQAIWMIDSVFDVEYSDNKLTKVLVQGSDSNEYDDKLISIINAARELYGYEISSGNRFFCGTPMHTNYVKSSWGGIQGPRLVNLRNIIGDLSDPSEVAQRLKGQDWQ